MTVSDLDQKSVTEASVGVDSEESARPGSDRPLREPDHALRVARSMSMSSTQVVASSRMLCVNLDVPSGSAPAVSSTRSAGRCALPRGSRTRKSEPCEPSFDSAAAERRVGCARQCLDTKRSAAEVTGERTFRGHFELATVEGDEVRSEREPDACNEEGDGKTSARKDHPQRSRRA